MKLPLWLRIIGAAILLSVIALPPLVLAAGAYHLGHSLGAQEDPCQR